MRTPKVSSTLRSGVGGGRALFRGRKATPKNKIVSEHPWRGGPFEVTRRRDTFA
jgi:hypothetical protein